MDESEASFQAAVIEVAERYGWTVGHVHDSRRQVRPGVLVGDARAAGIPDLILVHPGQRRVLWRELKTDTGRLRSAQIVWLRQLELAGADVDVWRPKDWDRVVLELSPVAV
jgi:hypothetical protein